MRTGRPFAGGAFERFDRRHSALACSKFRGNRLPLRPCQFVPLAHQHSQLPLSHFVPRVSAPWEQYPFARAHQISPSLPNVTRMLINVIYALIETIDPENITPM